MKHVCFSKKILETLSFCAFALITVSGGLFFLRGEVKPSKEEADGFPCLPGTGKVESTLTAYRPKAPVLVSIPPELSPSPGYTREQVASRGERTSTVIQGAASWYGGSDGLDGSVTASGEIFSSAAYTAAHRTLPFGTAVRVTYLRTGISTVVRINDRGPFIAGRIIDLSRAAAAAIGLFPDGTGMVQLEILD
ncbi:MAG: septal ring lytic transglycosylase RlpA family protein [Bacillota bacterium]